MKLFSAFSCSSLLVALSGCASFYPPASTHELKAGTPYVTNTDATRRLSILVPRANGMYATCSEPSPDVAVTLTQQVMAQAQVTTSGTTVDPTVQLEFSQAVVQLAQRTETIQFLRESLFRLCEQSINQNMTSDQTMQLYTIAMQTALKLAEADVAKNQSDLAKSLQDPKVRDVWTKVFGQAPVTPASPSVKH